MAKDTSLTKQDQVRTLQTKSVLSSMAGRYNTDGAQLLDTLKNTVFKKASNEQLVALCIVADQYNLNPFTREIYAFPDSKTGGIIPVVSIDGWLRIINDHPQFDGMEVENEGDECTVTIHRKDRNHPTVATEYLEECKRDTGPWQSHPARMLRHKAIIQCARIAFGFALKDPDEADRIMKAGSIDAESYETVPIAMPTALPQGSTAPKQEPAPKKTRKKKADKPPAEALPPVVGFIGNVFHKKSADNAKKAWERWGVEIDGVTYGTFDSNNGFLANQCKEEGCEVSITVEQNGEYWNLITIEKVEPIQEEPEQKGGDDLPYFDETEGQAPSE